MAHKNLLRHLHLEVYITWTMKKETEEKNNLRKEGEKHEEHKEGKTVECLGDSEGE